MHSLVHSRVPAGPGDTRGMPFAAGRQTCAGRSRRGGDERIGVSERVVELPRPSQTPEFERTPPQDVAAEQSVLGGMLLSKDAIADVVEVLRATDFYRPAHQTIFEKVLDLYGRGEPADAVTVAGELTRSGDIGRIGGAPYLHTLLSSVPTAANAGYYARIVAERAILRRLVEAGTRIVQLGYAADGGEVDDLVDRAQQAIYDVTERRTSEDYTVLGDVMQPAMDEMEAISSRAGTMTGVPTGFTDLDTLTNGLHPGQLIVVAGRPGLGKALGTGHPPADPVGLDDHGAGAPRGPAAGCGRPARAGGRGHGRAGGPALLRGALLRRLGPGGRRAAPVADAHPGIAAVVRPSAGSPYDR